MTAGLFFALAVVLFLLGFFIQALRPALMLKVLGLNVMSVAVFMAFLALANRHTPADPVVHAMVLTGIVVAISATAFALALIRALQHRNGHTQLDLAQLDRERVCSDAHDCHDAKERH